MISVNLINDEKMLVEGARIHIQGYSDFAFYAVPRVRADFTIDEELWDVVEERSGLCISDERGHFSVDEAAESAYRMLKNYVAADRLEALIERRVAELQRRGAAGAYLRFPKSAHRIAPTGGHPYI